MRGNRLGGISVHEWSHCMPGSGHCIRGNKLHVTTSALSECKEENIV